MTDYFLIVTVLIALLFLFLIVRWILNTYNTIKYYENEIEYLEGKIRIPIQKKVDLLPQLIDVIERNTTFERGTLREVAELRSSWAKSSSISNSNKINSAINALVYKVNEKYPKLMANRAFAELFREITRIETRIEQIRYSYNGQISNYNKAISLFPGLIVGRLFGFKRKPFFGA